MKRRARFSPAAQFALLSAGVLLIEAIVGSRELELVSIDPLLHSLIAVIIMGVIVGAAYPRLKKWKPKARNWQKHLPENMWGMVPYGAFLGVLIAALMPRFLPSTELIEIGFAPGALPHEVVGILIAAIIGITFALMIDARLGAGLFFGLAVGFPCGLIITVPQLHDTAWTLGGHAAIFGGLGLLHLLLKPMLDKTKKG
jgi:hypothetical protein